MSRPTFAAVCRVAGALVLLGVTGVEPAHAQLVGNAACGPVCSTPGRMVLCNDSIIIGQVQGLNCGAMAAQDEASCASFTAGGSPQTPAFVRGAYVITGPSGTEMPFELEVYDEFGIADPGARIASTATETYALPGDPSAVRAIDLAGLGDAYRIESNRFRLCMRKRFNGNPDLCLDRDGQAGSNWVYVAATRRWHALSDFGAALAGDFIIRVELDVPDRTPWMPGGACDATDAGVPDSTAGDVGAADAGAADAIAVDAGLVARDTGGSGPADAARPADDDDDGCRCVAPRPDSWGAAGLWGLGLLIAGRRRRGGRPR